MDRPGTELAKVAARKDKGTTRRTREIVAKLRGRGKVYADGKRIADVQYHPDVVQEFVIAESFGATDKLAGHSDASRLVRVISGESDLLFVEGTLVLYLQDGRGMEMLVKPSSGPRTWLVHRNSDFIQPDQMSKQR